MIKESFNEKKNSDFGISDRARALNLTVPLGSGRVGSDDLGYGPCSGFSFEPVQTSMQKPEFQTEVHVLS